MKPLRFTLQPLRVLREQKEQAAQKRYATAIAAVEQAEQNLREGNAKLANAWTELCEEVSAGAPNHKVQRLRQWCAELERRCGQLTTAAKKAQHTLNDANLEMMLAICDRQVLDRLYEKYRRTHARRAQHAEQKQLDEMGLRNLFNPIAFNPSQPQPAQLR
jgi:flagellar export protein FliJ